jgi:hypothetical protein
MYCLRDRFAPKRKVICVALMQEFQRCLLQTPVMLAGSYSLPVMFEDILMHEAAGASTGNPATF